MISLRIVATSVLTSTLIACGGGGGGSSSSSSTTTPSGPTVTPPALVTPPNTTVSEVCDTTLVDTSGMAQVTLSGTVSFERVPSVDTGLDYDNIVIEPARQVAVSACNALGTYAVGVTDDTGAYSFSVPANTMLRVLAEAKLVRTGSPSWDVRVVDNTRAKAQYAAGGVMADTGSTDSVRIGVIPHGNWDGSSYTEVRAAAPFAVLDSIYESISTVVASTPNANFPALLVNWSVNNQPVSGDPAQGNIGTSFYRSSSTEIYLLGKEDSDTDEYDSDVVVHEWGHYYQDTFSRSDNLGGPHSLSIRLDPRIAFDEGVGYAIAAFVNADATLHDSIGVNQSRSLVTDAETNRAFVSGGITFFNRGWYSEDSMINIVYDVMDSNADLGDNVALGFDGLNNVLINNDYINFDGVLTIYNFADLLKAQNPAEAANINTLLDRQEIFGITDAYGTGETNTGGNNLPVYSELTVGNTINLCSNRVNGGYNRLGNRRLVRMTIDTPGNYRITSTSTSSQSGIISPNPDFLVYRNASLVGNGTQSVSNQEILELSLPADTYLLDTFESANVFTDPDATSNTSESCFDLTLTAI